MVVLAHMPPDRKGARSGTAARVIATSHWTRVANSSSRISRTRAGSSSPTRDGPGARDDRIRDRWPAALRRRGRAAQGPGPAGQRPRRASGRPELGPARSSDRSDVAPAFVARSQPRSRPPASRDRVTFTGVLTGDRLEEEYAQRRPPRRALACRELRHGRRRSATRGASRCSLPGWAAFPRRWVTAGRASSSLQRTRGRSASSCANGLRPRPASRTEDGCSGRTRRTPPWSATTAIIAATLDDVALTGRREVIA